MKNKKNYTMTTGKRIKFFRKMHGLTQKALGEAVGFTKNPDIRIAQYESDSRKPKSDLLKRLADALDVHPLAFTLSLKKYNNLNQQVLIWIFLALEDNGILTPKIIDDEVALVINKDTFQYKEYIENWAYSYDYLKKEYLNKNEYDKLRYFDLIKELVRREK